MTLLTTHNPIRPLPGATARELMEMFIDQDTDDLLVGACLALTSAGVFLLLLRHPAMRDETPAARL